MFEPVWLGNYIVPRWEAVLLFAGTAIVGFMVFGAIVGLLVEAAIFIGKRFRF